MTETTMRMPYAGHVSFLGVPIFRNPEDLDWADIAVLGVPLDMATTHRAGARFGPRAIREQSMLYTYDRAGIVASHGPMEGFQGLYDIDERKTILQGYHILDCGDVPVLASELQVTFDRITRAVRWLLDHEVFPVFLGGDHAITYPIVRAWDGTVPIHIVHFDSHMDVIDELDGARFTHGSPFRHIMQLPFFDGITQIGVHGLLNDEVYHREMEQLGHTVITTGEIKWHGVASIFPRLPHGKNVYISIDIDVYDPAIAPGTGTPEPGGLTYWEGRWILREICRQNRVVGIDIVEVAPPYDVAGKTAHLAARVVMDVLGYVLGNKGRPDDAVRARPRTSLIPEPAPSGDG